MAETTVVLTKKQTREKIGELLKFAKETKKMSENKVVEMNPREEGLEQTVAEKAATLGTKLYKDYTIQEKKGDQTLPTPVGQDVLEMVRFFLTRAGPNVAQMGGKAKLAMSLVLDDHPKEGLFLELKGGMTLCAGATKWTARHVENDQITIVWGTEEGRRKENGQ